jgi:colicin import membrane protein
VNTPSPLPPEEGISFTALILAALVHVVLVGALFLGVQWKSQAPSVIDVEVWRSVAALPAAAKPLPPPEPPPPSPEPEPVPEPLPEPVPEPPPPPPPPSEPKPEPVPEPPPPAPPDPDIVIKERLEKERLEKERLEKERLEKERLEKERLEKERLEKERLEKERLEKERLEKERLEKERLEKERLEKERLEKERLEKERLEKERPEKERLEKERKEKERKEKERKEKERQEELRKQAEQEARRQKEIQTMIGGADAEIRRLRADQAAAARARGLAAYQAKIRGKIRSNIVLPPGIDGNPKAVFKVTQLPTGDIVGDVRISQSSGNKALDEAVVRAIRKSSPLPLPDDRSLFERDLNIPYQPFEE